MVKACKIKVDDWESLVGDDMFALQVIGDRIAKGIAPEKALEVYVNSVECDTSQLPNKLVKYAKCRGWLKGCE